MSHKLLKDIHALMEVKMNDVELLKPNAATGEERVDILLKMIQKKQPVELDAGGEIVIDPVKSKKFVDALKTGDEDKIQAAVKEGNKYKDVIIAKDGKAYKITALKKAAYFGGAGAGPTSDATKTAHQESAQAVALGLSAKLNRILKVEDLTSENMKKGMATYQGPDSLENVMGIVADPSWAKSTVNVTNEIRKGVNLKGLEFHRGSAWVKKLETKFNTLNKTPEGKTFTDINKWNPADIWLVKKGVDVPEANDLVEFKARLQRAYEENEIVGVSLKKSPKDTKSKGYNVDNDYDDDILNLKVKELLTSKTNNLFSSKAGFIFYEGQVPHINDVLLSEKRGAEMEIRSFKAQDNVNAEIKGKYAAGGKITFGPVNTVLKQMRLPLLTHRKDLAAKLDKDKKKDKEKYYGKLIREIISMVHDINPEIAKAAKKDFKDVAMAMDFPKLSSKYQAIELLHILKKTNAKKRKDFIQHAIRYASSRSELSSVFLKVW